MRSLLRSWQRRFHSVWLIVFALSTGFFLFPAWLVLVEIFFGGVVWILLNDEKKLIPNDLTSRQGVFFLFLALLLVITRVFPFFFSSDPFGYDSGIYRYEIWSSFQQLPSYVSNLFLGLPLVSNVFFLFDGSLDSVFLLLILFSGILPGLVFMMVARTSWGRGVGIMALFLFVFSLSQWRVYEMVLLKQLIALAFVFFGFWLFHVRSFLVVLVGAFLALLQPLDAFLLVISAFFFFLYVLVCRLPERRYFGTLFFLGLAGVLFFAWLEPAFWRHAWEIFSVGISQPSQLESSLQQGVFLSLDDYGYQSALLFVLGLLGWFYTLRFSRPTVMHAYLLVLLVWIASQSFFYQRLLIQLDAVLLCFAAVTVYRLWCHLRSDRFGRLSLSLLAVALIAPSLMTWARFQPTIDSPELVSIQSFCSRLPEGVYVAATDASYGPWLRGYCLRQRVFGPGLFEDNRWTEEEWRSFWSGERRSLPSMLRRYEHDLYFYVGKKQPPIDFDQGLFEWVEAGWWRGKKGSYGTEGL